MTKRIDFEHGHILLGDCLDHMAAMKPGSVDLVFFSPPYELARTYGIDFNLEGEEWVAWMVKVYKAALRVCKGLVAGVMDGQTDDYQWTATPALLMADLHRDGVNLRRPCHYHRVGIPGSGGPDWLRGDTEYIICASHPGRLPWSDNTAMGHLPKWAPGGEMSHRLADGARVNQWGMRIRKDGSLTATDQGKDKRTQRSTKPSHRIVTKAGHTKRRDDGQMEKQEYEPPAKANPGNLIHLKVGGGLMGSDIAHENEAAFPVGLPEFFIRSFCPPNGIVYDPFGGSGTTPAAAIKAGRRFIASDIRESQIQLMRRRIRQAESDRGFFTE